MKELQLKRIPTRTPFTYRFKWKVFSYTCSVGFILLFWLLGAVPEISNGMILDYYILSITILTTGRQLPDILIFIQSLMKQILLSTQLCVCSQSRHFSCLHFVSGSRSKEENQGRMRPAGQHDLQVVGVPTLLLAAIRITQKRKKLRRHTHVLCLIYLSQLHLKPGWR